MNKIALFGLVIAVAITGTATMSSLVVSANAQPEGTLYCIRPLVPPGTAVVLPLPYCFPTKQQCEDVVATLTFDARCIPEHPHGRPS